MSDLTLTRDVPTMIGRNLRMSVRNVDGFITAVALPVILLLMFVYLFGGAIKTGSAYVDYVVPGVLLVCAGFGAATTAMSVARDLESSIVDRFRSMDVRGESWIAGHVVASVLRNLFSTALVFAVAFAIGFRSGASSWGWLGALGVLCAFVVALSFLAAALGAIATSSESANGMSFAISFLAYPSSAFVPVATMPSWLQGFARNQPETVVIDSIRHLLSGTTVGSVAWISLLWSAGISAVSIVVGGVFYRRRTQG
jgi:ABC-2 type transport system permease protein